MTDLSAEFKALAEYRPTNKVRFVTAASLFDGHDAAIGIMRRILQSMGAEVIHLGHNRSVDEVVTAALQEDVQGIAVSSYQGGHNEYFTYMVELLKQRGGGNIQVMKGKYGPYVKFGKVNATLPKDKDPEQLTVEEAVALIEELNGIGIAHICFKPGTVEQIRSVIRIAAEVPTKPVIAHIEGGRAGGHHSWEDLDDLLLSTYSELRSRSNITVCVGCGIGTPERAAEYLSGRWSEAYGYPQMPVDGILVGTAAMACLEATTSPAVKQLLVDTAGTDQWVGAGTAQGGMASGRSQLGADIHEIDNAASRCGRLLDEVAGDGEAHQAEQQHDHKQRQTNRAGVADLQLRERLVVDVIHQGFGGIGWAALSASAEAVLVPADIQWSPGVCAAILFTALGPSIIAYRSWGMGVAQAGPAMAALFGNLTPLFAGLMQGALLGQWPQPYHLMAFGLIVGGIALSSLKRSP